MIRPDQKWYRRFRYDIVILTFLLLIGIGAWLNSHPFTFDAEDVVGEGQVPPQLGAGEILLLLPSGTGTATEFPEIDFSFAWYNTLAQEFGPFSIRRSDSFSPEDLDGITMFVVPANAAERLEAGQIGLIKSFVESGGVLIVELPTPEWVEVTGISDAVLVGRSTKRISAANASPLQGDFNKHLLDTPLNSRLMRLDTVDLSDVARKDVLLEIDGVPAHFHRPLGQGHVFVVGFDYGMALTSLQQGVPEDDLSIVAAPPEDGEERDEDDEGPPFTFPDQLVANQKLRQSTVPYADLLERHMFYSVTRYRPMPRLWIYPGRALGAVVLTHSEGGFGDKASFLAEYEGQKNLTSTYFVSASNITNDGLDTLGEAKAEVGVAWHTNYDAPIYKPEGVGRLKPMQTALTLAEQRDMVEGWAGRRVRASKAHGLAWERDYTLSFRKMAGANIHIDSTYGPREEGDFGYLFGTGLPFHPIDVNGLLLPLNEFPFALSDGSGFAHEDEDLVVKMIKESRKGFHQLVTINIDADAMARDPKPSTLEGWIRAMDTAGTERHWVTNLREFSLLQNTRRGSTLSSSFDVETATLTFRVDIPQMMDRSGDVPLTAPGVAVPLRYQGQTLESIRLNGGVIEMGSLERTGDGVLVILEVPAGSHQISVGYAKGP